MLFFPYRNGITHGGPVSNHVLLFRRISSLYSELVGVHPTPSLRSSLAWTPPPEGWIKVNFDAALSNSGAAVACIARHSDGSVVRWATWMVNTSLLLVAEGLAADLVVDLACEARIQQQMYMKMVL